MALFYKQKVDSSRIRRALKHIAPAFWPVFGDYRTGQIYFERYHERDYVDEITFNHEFDLADSPDALFAEYSRFNPAVAVKLFHLQIVQYPNTTVLIPKMNHLAGDGYSYFYFLSMLAAVSGSKSYSVKVMMRRLLYKPRHYRTTLREFLLKTGGVNSSPPDIKYNIRFERIPRAEIYQYIKEIKTNFNITVTTNDLLAAMALQKLVGLRGNSFGPDVTLTMPMDVRRQIAEYGRKFFGNALLFARISFETKSVRDSNINELARKIREKIPVVTREKYLEYLHKLEELIAGGQWSELIPYDPQQGCLVTNLTRLPLNELDFGSGKPDFILPLTIEKNSAALLTDQNDYVLRLAY
jgi:hypothetical protein